MDTTLASGSAAHGAGSAPTGGPTTTELEEPSSWGTWGSDQRYYSLEIVQQPLRARMCGFGDKDRRPVAPAPIVRLNVQENGVLISHEDVDVTFFIVTVDLWSLDGHDEQNLVLNTFSGDRPPQAPRRRRRGLSDRAGYPQESVLMPEASDTILNSVEPPLPAYTIHEQNTSPSPALLGMPTPVYAAVNHRNGSYVPWAGPSSSPAYDMHANNPTYYAMSQQSTYRHVSLSPPHPPQEAQYTAPLTFPSSSMRSGYEMLSNSGYGHQQQQYSVSSPTTSHVAESPAHQPWQISNARISPVRRQMEHISMWDNAAVDQDETRSHALNTRQDIAQPSWVTPSPAPTNTTYTQYHATTTTSNYSHSAPADNIYANWTRPQNSLQPSTSSYYQQQEHEHEHTPQHEQFHLPPQPIAPADRYGYHTTQQESSYQSMYHRPHVPQTNSAYWHEQAASPENELPIPPPTLPVPPPNLPIPPPSLPIPPSNLPIPPPTSQHHMTSMPDRMVTPPYIGGPGGPLAEPPIPSYPGDQNAASLVMSPAPNPNAERFRHPYIRTLVGPLVASATRLLDEHDEPGIFFLFSDLSVRTEGKFRLRFRLMNVGAPPAPSFGSFTVHTGTSPVLAETFSDRFEVWSAKRFPGVPDNTAISIAFAEQGQKLPLRSKNGVAKGRRKRRRGDDSPSSGEGSE